MNLVLLSKKDFASDGRVRVTGRRLDHVRQVLRAEAGDTIRVGELGGRLGTGVVDRVSDAEIVLDVMFSDDPPVAAPITLLLALPRPKVLSRVLTIITVMGVKSVVLFDCWRVEKSFWSSPRLDPQRIESALLEGLEQARDTILPSVRIARRFRPFVEDELPTLIEDKRAILAHPSPAVSPDRYYGQIVAAIGPEGGFIPNEVAMFERTGFERFSLGPRILHVEAAVPALLGKLS